MHLDSQKHDVSFGEKKAYHINFMYENCMICIFSLAKNTILR